MRRWLPVGVVVACLIGLFTACFHAVLFQGEQFAFRDAGHFYYPLYQRVQQEWTAGRVPLWSPEENGGVPLLGNPTAAVLYPGKLVYAVLPYGWAARSYTIGHVLLAIVAMYVLLRSWAVSRCGSAIAGVSYAFSGPILIQYSNIVFLVGAAWTPLGIRAADRWLRLEKRGAVVELALVFAMQFLGGDPEAAYVLGTCAGGYAVYLHRVRVRVGAGDSPAGRARKRRSRVAIAFAVAAALAIWIAASLLGAWYFPQWRARVQPIPVLPWIPALRISVVCAWGLVGLLIIRASLRGRGSDLGRMLGGIAASALLAGCLSGAQLLPVLEFMRLTQRAAVDVPHDVYLFSVSPLSGVEWLWPSFYGNGLSENAHWMSALPGGLSPRIWFPTLYCGGLVFVLALSALFSRAAPPWQTWLAAIAIVSCLAGLGEFGSPLRYARRIPGVARLVGPSDPPKAPVLRPDGHLRDGDGGVYWLLTTVLPGFGSFRYPAKLFTFTTLAICAIAGAGWDRFASQGCVDATRIAALAFLFSAALATVVFFKRAGLENWVANTPVGQTRSILGPFDVKRAWTGTWHALLHGVAVYGAALAVLCLTRKHATVGGMLALALVAVDLAAANSKYIYSVPQAFFETKPRVLELIEEAERQDPSPGPFRVHRMPTWFPPEWYATSVARPTRRFVDWGRNTIEPKYGLPYGLEYTHTVGAAELLDSDLFFAPFEGSVGAEDLPSLNLHPLGPLVYYPRRGFDLWNTRYFVLPRLAANTEQRGITAFLENVRAVYPPPSSSRRRFTEQENRKWNELQDWQILRDENAFPRAWVVHQIRYVKPIASLALKDREGLMREILYQNDSFWHMPEVRAYDARIIAWIEAENGSLAKFTSRSTRDDSDNVRFVSHSPQRLELEVNMKRPGVVVLADVNYPGWELSIDGVRSPILRTNLLMRGAAVEAGTHRLIYAYRPWSFFLGLGLSALGGVALIGVAAWARRPRSSSP
jgi:hypothetical protein